MLYVQDVSLRSTIEEAETVVVALQRMVCGLQADSPKQFVKHGQQLRDALGIPPHMVTHRYIMTAATEFEKLQKRVGELDETMLELNENTIRELNRLREWCAALERVKEDK